MDAVTSHTPESNRIESNRIKSNQMTADTWLCALPFP